MPLTDEERRERQREKMRLWRAKNPERAREAVRRHRANNPEKARESNRKWREANKDKARQASDRWADNNRERLRATRNAWHAANLDTIKVKRRTRYAERAEEIRQKAYALRCERKRTLIEMLGGTCKDCGNVVHLAAFEFDHVRGTKTKNLALLLGGAPWEVIVEEAMKCDLVCANCHRVRTATRTGRV